MVLLALNYMLSFNSQDSNQNLHFACKSPCLALQHIQILSQIVTFSSLTLTSSAESNAIPSNFVFFVPRFKFLTVRKIGADIISIITFCLCS